MYLKLFSLKLLPAFIICDDFKRCLNLLWNPYEKVEPYSFSLNHGLYMGLFLSILKKCQCVLSETRSQKPQKKMLFIRKNTDIDVRIKFWASINQNIKMQSEGKSSYRMWEFIFNHITVKRLVYWIYKALKIDKKVLDKSIKTVCWRLTGYFGKQKIQMTNK